MSSWGLSWGLRWWAGGDGGCANRSLPVCAWCCSVHNAVLPYCSSGGLVPVWSSVGIRLQLGSLSESYVRLLEMPEQPQICIISVQWLARGSAERMYRIVYSGPVQNCTYVMLMELEHGVNIELNQLIHLSASQWGCAWLRLSASWTGIGVGAWTMWGICERKRGSLLRERASAA